MPSQTTEYRQEPSQAIHPAAANGLRAYARMAQAAITPTQASLILHERLCQELVAAKAAYEARRLDQMCRHTEKSMRVLLALQNDIKLVRGNPQPLILKTFYLHLFQKLHLILNETDTSAAFDDLITKLTKFCKKMREAQVRAA